MLYRSFSAGVWALLAACIFFLAPATNVFALQLMAYDMEGTVSTANGPGVADVSGLGTPLDATLVGSGAVVADATRPGGGAGNQVLSTGSGPTFVGAATADNHPGLAKLNTTGSFTLAAWARGTSTGGFRQLFGRGHQGERLYAHVNNPSEDLGLVVSNGIDAGGSSTGFDLRVVDATPDINDDLWHHLAASYRAPAQEVDFFVDGSLISTVSVPFVSRNPVGSGGGVGIGMRFDGADLVTDWFIDDAVMWNEAAAPAKIAAIARGDMNGADVSFIGVPEPAACILLATAVLPLAFRRRRG